MDCITRPHRKEIRGKMLQIDSAGKLARNAKPT
jgi:hypothetical protein